MEAIGLRHVSVWVDEAAPERGAFSHALDWAARLGLPLRGITSLPRLGGRTAGLARLGGESARGVASDALLTGKLGVCATACARRRVPWEAALWQGPLVDGVDEFLRPAQLSVFGDALPPALKEQLLRRSLRSPGTPVLVCPRARQPISRVLILDEHGEPAGEFLDSTARLCHVLRVTPVVLTVAPTEREAQRRQRLAEERFGACRQPADFDFVVGLEVRAAVAWVARWRRCSHVFVEHRSAPPGGAGCAVTRWTDSSGSRTPSPSWPSRARGTLRSPPRRHAPARGPERRTGSTWAEPGRGERLPAR